MPGEASSFKSGRGERSHFVSCTLCGKHQLDVEKLIHASPNIYVCIQCIDVMHATVRQWGIRVRELSEIANVRTVYLVHDGVRTSWPGGPRFKADR